MPVNEVTAVTKTPGLQEYPRFLWISTLFLLTGMSLVLIGATEVVQLGVAHLNSSQILEHVVIGFPVIGFGVLYLLIGIIEFIYVLKTKVFPPSKQ